MAGPLPHPGVLSIDPYVGGKSSAAGVSRIIKLSSNESAFGPSPKAAAALAQAGTNLHRYPDGHAADLRQAIATKYGLNADRIVCGAGSDELLALLAQAYLGPGLEAIHTEHGFLMYRISTLAAGGTPVVAAERGLRTDIDAVLAAVTPQTRLVFIANPNNPTGSYLTTAEMRTLRDGLPADVILVVDAAYAEYVRRNDYEAGIELVATHDNVVMTRTFSKIYGLGGLRLGWSYCPVGIADTLNRVRGPFNVSAPAQAAGIAALADDDFVETAIVHNVDWLARLTDGFNALGLTAYPSVGNFVLVRFPSDKPAARAETFLAQRGLLVRAVANYGLPDCLRITIGLAEENEAVLAACKDYLA